VASAILRSLEDDTETGDTYQRRRSLARDVGTVACKWAEVVEESGDFPAVDSTNDVESDTLGFFGVGDHRVICSHGEDSDDF
jgi:hypothetical protein